MKYPVIVSIVRTPIGSFGGSLSTMTAVDIGAVVVKEALKRVSLKPELIDNVILGHVLQAGQGQNTARQVGLISDIPIEVPAITINQVCGSGLRAISLAAQIIKAGDAEVVVAGGMEVMSNVPYALFEARTGYRLGNGKIVDLMINDGLWDATNDYHMGITAENLADKWNVSREEADEFALHSQQKAESAIKAGAFLKEIAPVSIYLKGKKSVDFCVDEYPRFGLTIEKLSKLKPAFSKTGIVTAGNSSGINDGAAVAIVMSAKKATELGIVPLASIISYASIGVSPDIMGTGAIVASRKALKLAKWQIEDLDLIESNEAFAAQAIVVNRVMSWDSAKVNVNGGAIALGHPIGATGARILTSLIYSMKRRNKKRGLATLCVGGGQGVAMTIEMQ